MARHSNLREGVECPTYVPSCSRLAKTSAGASSRKRSKRSTFEHLLGGGDGAPVGLSSMSRRTLDLGPKGRVGTFSKRRELLISTVQTQVVNHVRTAVSAEVPDSNEVYAGAWELEILY
jgi:hypothetical protein